MTIRPAYKAGAWYSADANRLAADVDACLDQAAQLFGTSAPTPGKTPVAGIAPHAGLVYSGPVAATVFSLLRQALPDIEVFLVCGACHRKRLDSPALWPDGEWKTPLGPIRVDETLASALIENNLAVPDRGAHDDDNAIELLTPFIKHMFPDAGMVP
ncbi:MAG: AmmeMemoRadiSam system protein B, partial [Planctomycetes bacterium]|nr:AmmeMemoRadiSam system protein B [Planctomycetota bacterium]